MSLCEQCQSISTVVEGPEEDWQLCYRHDLASFRRAVEVRCFFCAQLFESFSQEQEDVLAGPSFTRIECSLWRAYDPPDPEMGTLLFRLGPEFDGIEGAGSLRNEFTLLAPDVCKIAQKNSLAANTNESKCWGQLSRWINRCKSSHKTCIGTESRWLPTRLIDTANHKTGSVKLVDTSKMNAEPYVSLSHCWGKREFVTTNENNVAEFEKGIAIRELPLNFQDAIFATSQLGFRYLWIDSLCIIQGSEDWACEAPLMNKLYRNSVLTLAATASSDAFGGFFRKRDTDFVEPLLLQVQMKFQCSELSDCFAFPADFWLSEIRNAPLHQRAWAVQERALSPRTVHFCENQLVWECREVEACESFPDGIPWHFFQHDTIDHIFVGFKSWEAAMVKAMGKDKEAQASSRSIRYDNPYEGWAIILSEYTRCNLTRPEDIFVALSGVVKEFQVLLDDEYMAGLWRKNFVNGLLWHSLASSARPSRYRAPTWSWASVEVPAIRQPDIYQLRGNYAEVLEINVEAKGADKTGEIGYAEVSLRGHLVKIRRPRRFREFSRYNCGIFYSDVDEEIVGDELFCVPLKEDIFPSVHHQLWGLVLLPAEGEEVSSQKEVRKYKRAGVFSMDIGEPLVYLGQKRPKDWISKASQGEWYKATTWDESPQQKWFDTAVEKVDFILI